MLRPQRRDLPIGEMAAKKNAPGAGVAQAVENFGPDHLDASTLGVAVDLAEVGVFRRDPAQVVPHPADNALDLGAPHLGEGAAEVLARPPRNRQARPQCPAHQTADARGAVDGEPAEGGKGGPNQRRLDRAAQALDHRPSAGPSR